MPIGVVAARAAELFKLTDVNDAAAASGLCWDVRNFLQTLDNPFGVVGQV